MESNKYIVAPLTEYDEDKMLWETYVGRDDKEMTLSFSVWGESSHESRIEADTLMEILNEYCVIDRNKS